MRRPTQSKRLRARLTFIKEAREYDGGSEIGKTPCSKTSLLNQYTAYNRENGGGAHNYVTRQQSTNSSVKTCNDRVWAKTCDMA